LKRSNAFQVSVRAGTVMVPTNARNFTTTFFVTCIGASSTFTKSTLAITTCKNLVTSSIFLCPSNTNEPIFTICDSKVRYGLFSVPLPMASSLKKSLFDDYASSLSPTCQHDKFQGEKSLIIILIINDFAPLIKI
ncbi:MAG: hypothetical protein UT91_C0031G0012, partial [Parcubacteria group bacterium GW2011_GWA2_40_23]